MSKLSGIMAEIAAAILSVKEPFIDLSDPGKLYAQALPLARYADEPADKFPMAFAIITGETAELVANDRFERASEIEIAIIYKIDQVRESISDGVHRGQNCLLQIAKKILSRQTSGEALLPLYLSGDISIDVTADVGTDHSDTDLVNGAATAKFTAKQFQITEDR
jgi:hypothetical protein